MKAKQLLEEVKTGTLSQETVNRLEQVPMTNRQNDTFGILVNGQKHLVNLFQVFALVKPNADKVTLEVTYSGQRAFITFRQLELAVHNKGQNIDNEIRAEEESSKVCA